MKLLVMMTVVLMSGQALGSVEKKGLEMNALRSVPVQTGGRIKPIDSFSRDLVLFTTGSRSFRGWDPLEMVLSWIMYSKKWETVQFIVVNNIELKKQLVLDEDRKRFSPDELMRNAAFVQYAATAPKQTKDETSKKLTREKELQDLVARLSTFRSVVSGEAFTLLPQEPRWGNIRDPDQKVGEIHSGFAHLLKAYDEANQIEFNKRSDELYREITSKIPNWASAFEKKIKAEVFYHELNPFQKSWILYLLAALLWLWARAASGGNPVWLRVSAAAVTAFALLLHATGFAIRVYVSGRAPVTNMYESVVWVAFGVILFAFFLYLTYRQPILFAVACFVSSFCLIAGSASPAIMDPSIQPLVPVLRSNYWLTIHVLTITLSYAAFALALGIGNVALFHHLPQNRLKDGIRKKISGLTLLMYRTVQIGVVLLAAGTILGGVWADESWGRFWGWDPKEVWALIALLGYLMIIHARYAGYIKEFGFAAWTVIAFVLVVMAWYGVNFVLGVGLHSYGFSDGGRGVVFSFVSLQLLYVLYIALMRKHNKQNT